MMAAKIHPISDAWPKDDPEAVRLLAELKHLWVRRQRATDQRWSRTLPLGDYVVDRWEKARLLGFGEGTSVYDNVLILGDVRVGNQTWIGPNTVLDGSGGLTIGSHCDISAGVQVYSHDSVAKVRSGGTVPVEHAPTYIGDRVYLGPNVIVAKGVTIGDGCVIGANSLVLRDVPPNSKAFGTPCRVVETLPEMTLEASEG
ncbi:MAG: acyltransferase [Rhodothermales bacterium]